MKSDETAGALAGANPPFRHGRPAVAPFPGILARDRILIRLADVLLTGLFLACMVPVGLAVAALILAFDGRPVLFRQSRVGFGLKEFTVVKFRTMVVGAEKIQEEILREASEPNVQRKNDRRVTAVGRVLRSLSLDEIPQLLSVLSGRMSLVGPRPLIPAEVVLLPPEVLPRFRVLPGITGLAQISGRSRLSVWTILSLDLQWVEGYSFGLYLKILWKTVSAVLRTGDSH